MMRLTPGALRISIISHGIDSFLLKAWMAFSLLRITHCRAYPTVSRVDKSKPNSCNGTLQQTDNRSVGAISPICELNEGDMVTIDIIVFFGIARQPKDRRILIDYHPIRFATTVSMSTFWLKNVKRQLASSKWRGSILAVGNNHLVFTVSILRVCFVSWSEHSWVFVFLTKCRKNSRSFVIWRISWNTWPRCASGFNNVDLVKIDTLVRYPKRKYLHCREMNRCVLLIPGGSHKRLFTPSYIGSTHE